ncbi:MAG: four helix bundle protein [Candidatus Margulisbacteria bacterium]|nr:four helix bundle protein [Candidatus Margulisiibacteriota bacterium]
MKTHKDFDVWKESVDLVTRVYKITKSFPKAEMYGLILQIRKSAVSIPSNIAEGAARNSDKEFLQYLYISLGSLSELETQLIISKNLEYLKKEDTIFEQVVTIRQMLLGLIKYLNPKCAVAIKKSSY